MYYIFFSPNVIELSQSKFSFPPLNSCNKVYHSCSHLRTCWMTVPLVITSHLSISVNKYGSHGC